MRKCSTRASYRHQHSLQKLPLNQRSSMIENMEIVKWKFEIGYFIIICLNLMIIYQNLLLTLPLFRKSITLNNNKSQTLNHCHNSQKQNNNSNKLHMFDKKKICHACNNFNYCQYLLSLLHLLSFGI